MLFNKYEGRRKNFDQDINAFIKSKPKSPIIESPKNSPKKVSRKT